MWWTTVLAWLEKKALGLSVKQWLYIALAVAFVVQDIYVYGKGEDHYKNVIEAVSSKAQAKQIKKDQEAAKEAVQNASKEADKLNEIDKSTKENEDKANEVAKQADHPAECDLTDPERLYLRSLIDKANNSE